MSKVSVRKASVEDLDTIMSFNVALARESEGLELDQAILRQGVQSLLLDSSKGQYFLAESEGQLVGQMMYTSEWSDWRNGNWMWIQSVYINPSFRKQGLFRILLATLQDIADRSPDVVGLRLYVDKDNQSAMRCYERCDFDYASYQIMYKS